MFRPRSILNTHSIPQNSTAHPDPTIYPVLLNKIGKKLKEHYGWVPAHFELKGNTDIAFDDDLD